MCETKNDNAFDQNFSTVAMWQEVHAPIGSYSATKSTTLAAAMHAKTVDHLGADALQF